MMKILCSSLLFITTAATLVAADNGTVCISETSVYTARVNLYAGELGEFAVLLDKANDDGAL